MCVQFRTTVHAFPSAPETASSREEGELIHRNEQLKGKQFHCVIITQWKFSISVSSRVSAWQPNRNSRGRCWRIYLK